ncbi:structural protein [Xenorhabdus beddingii]|uniref:Structural protein n=1 Tax=Xenorhabdus beddingii TaxID=40578 RepID=A0A1Y2SRV6_9GAMM|nr:hypothetical protein [Xenorhabdus beddingii]OTA21061.1 structural protein [Xenorhabdus beddingii]
MSRGIRNNNPGNIDHNPKNKWQGQLRHDPKIEKRFCRFESPEYGIRALMKLLSNYHKNGYQTVLPRRNIRKSLQLNLNSEPRLCGASFYLRTDMRKIQLRAYRNRA